MQCTGVPSNAIELVVIDADTKVRQLRQELEWNEVAYGLKNGFVA